MDVCVCFMFIFLYYKHNVFIVKLDMASVGNLSASVGNLSINEDPSTEERMWVCKYSLLNELSDDLKHIDAKNFNWFNLLYFDLEIYRHKIAKREGREYVTYSP